MNVLYEEEGEFKVGAVLSQSPASFQVESPHGRRSKIKAASVVLSFERPAGTELLVEARKFAEGLDTGDLQEAKAPSRRIQQLAELPLAFINHPAAALLSRPGILTTMLDAPHGI